MNKVLIVYGTRFGATKSTSEKIFKILKEKQIEVRHVDSLEKQIPMLRGYDGIIVGTGIKMGMWTKQIKKFFKKTKKDFAERSFKFGFFVNCGTAAEKKKISEAKEKYIDKKLEKIGLSYDIANAFGPIYDFSDSSLMSNINKKLMKAGLKEDGWEKVEDIRYDLRDMEQIQKFAEQFASLI